MLPFNEEKSVKGTCFFTCYDAVFEETARGLVRSTKKFYPNVDFLEFMIPKPERGAGFNLRAFCDFHLQTGKELLKEYKRIISVDTDHIMCNECPDLFKDYDFGFVQNNIPVGPEYGGSPISDVYINAGLTICTNPEVWELWTKEYYDRCSHGFEVLHEQNALNFIFHHYNHKYKFELLEYQDKSYGISNNFIYHEMYLDNNELTLTNGKKVCMFHAAGTEWKDKLTGKIHFDHILDKRAKERMEFLCL